MACKLNMGGFVHCERDAQAETMGVASADITAAVQATPRHQLQAAGDNKLNIAFTIKYVSGLHTRSYYISYAHQPLCVVTGYSS